jgi:hypothetical protein
VLPNADDVEAYRAGRLFDELETMTGPRDLPPEQWPRLFWLANENDLSTARFAPRPSFDYGPLSNVAPLKPLADILGPGADIAGVTIERTDAPISKDLHRRFSWLNGMNGDDGSREWDTSRPFWANLQRQYFALRGEANNMTS